MMMKLIVKGVMIVGCLLMLCHLVGFMPMRKTDRLRVLLVVGGHEFNESAFYAMMKTLPGVRFDTVRHPDVYSHLTEESLKGYDALLFYDMPRTISDSDRAIFESIFKQGKGIVFLHHAVCRYTNWDGFTSIIGGAYHEQKWTNEGIEMPASTYKHDVSFRVKVLDTKHPVTAGIEDFDITDETYGQMELLPHIYPLLTTDEPTASGCLAWITDADKSKIATILLGHDERAWSNPSFVRLLLQSLRWVRSE